MTSGPKTLSIPLLRGMTGGTSRFFYQEFDGAIKTIAIIADKSLRYERLSRREIRPLTKEEANLNIDYIKQI